MGWTDISQYVIDDILGFQSMNQIVDNFNYLFVGAAGQAHVDTSWLTNLAATTAKIDNLAVTEGKLGASSVALSKLKTSTGVSSGAGAAANVEFAMQDYCFFPNIHGASATNIARNQSTTSAGTVGRFALYVQAATAYTVRWRYVTATDEPFMYAIQDKVTWEIERVWMCEDPPPGYWGLDEKPDGFMPPIIISDENGVATDMADKEEITIFKHPKEEFFDILNRSDKDKKCPHEILTEKFEYDKGKKLFKTKNLTDV